MKFIEWLKWKIAAKEMAELEQWHTRWHEHRRWFAESSVAALTLDHLKYSVDGDPSTNIQTVIDNHCRLEINNKQIKITDEMVTRFLGWRVPEDFNPDCYITFDREKATVNNSWPIGTNLLSADQAKKMFEQVLGGK